MTTNPVTTIADEQLAEVEQRHTILLQRGQSLPDALGLPRDTRFTDTPIRSLLTIKGGRRYLEVRNG
ncbi:hypothetical protein QYS36_18995 [Pseudomonas sp. G34]|uniref:hypothetical protein n=1 Tax=Pseudomonas sp. G34 TaxID=3059083 RepID=UPI0028086E7F|nr:hypothetical protein [Pseudomonas sp. G34]MDQ7987032.1 hypothetical protein [Pseudomonas sp. G34]